VGGSRRRNAQVVGLGEAAGEARDEFACNLAMIRDDHANDLIYIDDLEAGIDTISLKEHPT
jgi:hypothetical protein